MKQMKDLPKEDRPAYGQRVNEVRQAIEGRLLNVKRYLLKHN